ncbi:hypothetical protein [Mycobacterium sp. E2479]|uniref:hypothetical protein n=1 Tax=Mycobacterium sp. E2479 TaxID=1834134 RepID=UPI0007FE2F3A|nr:hypothetical protein [Mycobacterium sp. E2479]OBH49283.1 hypothetical protein A5686_15505 [Mycobacterium sp. E2479]
MTTIDSCITDHDAVAVLWGVPCCDKVGLVTFGISALPDDDASLEQGILVKVVPLTAVQANRLADALRDAAGESDTWSCGVAAL